MCKAEILLVFMCVIFFLNFELLYACTWLHACLRVVCACVKVNCFNVCLCVYLCCVFVCLRRGCVCVSPSPLMCAGIGTFLTEAEVDGELTETATEKSSPVVKSSASPANQIKSPTNNFNRVFLPRQ